MRKRKKTFSKEDMQSSTEMHLLKALREIHLYPEEQYPIGEMFVDFAFPEIDLVIEVDGPHHKLETQSKKDMHRTYYLRERGWRVWRFSAKYVYWYPRKVANKILELIKIKGLNELDILKKRRDRIELGVEEETSEIYYKLCKHIKELEKKGGGR